MGGALEECPMWNFDGRSTAQAEGNAFGSVAEAGGVFPGSRPQASAERRRPAPRAQRSCDHQRRLHRGCGQRLRSGVHRRTLGRLAPPASTSRASTPRLPPASGNSRSSQWTPLAPVTRPGWPATSASTRATAAVHPDSDHDHRGSMTEQDKVDQGLRQHREFFRKRMPALRKRGSGR